MPIDPKYSFVLEYLKEGLSLDCSSLDISYLDIKRDIIEMTNRLNDVRSLTFSHEGMTLDTMKSLSSLAEKKNINLIFKLTEQ